MKRKTSSLLRLFLFGLLLSHLSGWASAVMKGGALVGAGYQPKKILITYKAEGTVPPNIVYQLVETDRGEAIFEKSPDGSGTLFLLHWKDDDGDHFGDWVATSHGYEFVVPFNRSKNAKKYFYSASTFSYEPQGDSGRLVPIAKMDPVATLIPQ